MSKLRIAILHFQPLELYPPVMNALNVFDAQLPDTLINVYTNDTGNKAIRYGKELGNHITISRRLVLSENISKWRRLWRYCRYYFVTLAKLVYHKPHIVLYYETISSWPAVVYKKYFNRNSRLYIHYHEYTSQQEYATGMALTRAFHRLEKKIYPKVFWVSHTNAFRMGLFKNDNPVLREQQLHIMPNYPPAKWQDQSGSGKQNTGNSIKFIYAGAVGLETMYLKEITAYINKNNNYTLDIYSNYLEPEALAFLQNNTRQVNIKGTVAYDELPAIYRQYDVGLILYKGSTPNYIFNAPNKLFEYLVCGLQVWFPKEMTGCLEYESPSVHKVDFTKLETDGAPNLIMDIVKTSESKLKAENVYRQFIDSFLQSP